MEASKTRLKRAIKEKSVVCATPASIKSLLLKYIDLLFQSAETPRMVQLSDSLLTPTLTNELAPLRSRCIEVETMADHLAYILGMWRTGVALLDEVDLLLHPLKSELNWPLGIKRPLDFTESKKGAGLRWKIPGHLLDAIFYAQNGKMIHAFAESREAVVILNKIKVAVEKGVKMRFLQNIPHLCLIDYSYYTNTCLLYTSPSPRDRG